MAAADFGTEVFEIDEFDARVDQNADIEGLARSRKAREVTMRLRPASWEHASMMGAPVEKLSRWPEPCVIAPEAEKKYRKRIDVWQENADPGFIGRDNTAKRLAEEHRVQPVIADR